MLMKQLKGENNWTIEKIIIIILILILIGVNWKQNGNPDGKKNIYLKLIMIILIKTSIL